MPELKTITLSLTLPADVVAGIAAAGDTINWSAYLQTFIVALLDKLTMDQATANNLARFDEIHRRQNAEQQERAAAQLAARNVDPIAAAVDKALAARGIPPAAPGK